jgi:hypothetical protein
VRQIFAALSHTDRALFLELARPARACGQRPAACIDGQFAKARLRSADLVTRHRETIGLADK